MVDLCKRYGISRNAGYELLRRFDEAVPRRIAAPEHPDHCEVRRVSNAGCFRLYSGRQFLLSQALNGERVGFEEIDDGLWNILFYARASDSVRA